MELSLISRMPRRGRANAHAGGCGEAPAGAELLYVFCAVTARERATDAARTVTQCSASVTRLGERAGSGYRARHMENLSLAELHGPLLLSLKIAGTATLVSGVFGIVLAWYCSRRHGPVTTVLDVLCTLPLVLPPTVLGYYLILLVGRRGLLGPALEKAGIQLIFSWQGAVIAAGVVVFPLIYKSARAALESVDHSLEDAARTLGASELKVFLRISLPLAARSLAAGTALAFARGMGEFGATLMVAGNIPGRTQTLALGIYDAFQAGNDALAGMLAVITSLACAAVLCLAEFLVTRRRHGR